ncbi:MAG: hypothetical protein AAB446_01700 [Patescibacteria group bacterium]
MTTKLVVADGTEKRVPNSHEWETLYKNKFPELIRRLKEGNLDPIAINDTFQAMIEGKVILDKKPVFTHCLTLGYNILIEQTYQRRIISRTESVFAGGMSSNFDEWDLNISPRRPNTFVDIYELIRDGDFKTIYNSFGRSLDNLCLTQDQIIDFVEHHRERLCKYRHYTFFLIKIDDNFFVVGVKFSSEFDLYADVFRFTDDNFWFAEHRHRFVIPRSFRTF